MPVERLIVFARSLYADAAEWRRRRDAYGRDASLWHVYEARRGELHQIAATVEELLGICLENNPYTY